MTRTLRAGALVLTLTAGCGADPVSSVAIIVLTNTWQEEGNVQHTLQFLDDTDGTPQSSGNFTGTETLPDGSEFDLAGWWQNGRVTLTTQRAPSVTWRADITEDNADRLDFTSSAGRLVVVRNVN